jgi:hypothetical protein
VEIAGQVLDEKCRVIVVELDFGSLYFDFHYLDLVR